uniref:hypothetical protein n=1 Tax=Xylella fastidiosa TaxID=2371 RepID=UPI001F4EB29E|nr:hypothetical protein [Xylella fastidiosa]
MSLNGWQRIFIGVCVLVIVLAIFIGFMTYPEESKSFYTNRCFGIGVENTYTIEEAKKRLKQLRLSDLETWGGVGINRGGKLKQTSYTKRFLMQINS